MTKNISSILGELFSEQELVELASALAKFHRIQGSRELERAGEYIRNEMETLDEFNVNTYTYEYGIQYGLHPPVTGWNLNECFVELIKPYKKTLLTHLHSKVCAVAHSPPGDIEGEIVYVGEGTRGLHYRGKDVSDKIVLAHGNPHIVYRIAQRFGAKGFVFFKPGICEDAIPYLSLFLAPEEAAVAKAPAIAISRRDAHSIVNMLERGLKPYARIFVDAEYSGSARINVIEAAVGEGESELHVFAHYCHPAGTVNDNVSGSATLLELAKAFDRALHRNVIALPRYRKIVFVWFPEYYGSLPYLLSKSSHQSSRIEFGINLDMIGEKQELTKSTINIIRPPIFVSNTEYESVLIKYLIESLSINKSFSNTFRIVSYRIDINPYDGGSDHDIYLQFSIPSIMINQWPDAFYHTNLDSIDKFDSFLAKRIGVGVGTALYMLSSNSLSREVVEMLSNGYREYVDGYAKLKSDIEMLKNLKLMENSSSGKLQKHSVKFRYRGDKGVLMLRSIFKSYSCVEELESMLEFLEKQPIQFLFTHYIPLLLMHRPLGMDEIRFYIALEYGMDVDEGTLNKIISYLKQLGLVEEVPLDSNH
ncbi:MAG: DUF4910 domain-containing protein [Ignisphaera sp.]|nr:DUF4910 domain-containing protein [Ignisphaera sp.]MCX8167885.1 DUF4910 domain-containing protein [Ignisphaera sp.]MDW8085474.1 DUF4910 domain-containing protein [Ignisphaera sp.]